MAIRLSNNCTNCTQLSATLVCNVHQVKVSESYTCDNFTLKENMNAEKDCTSCARHNDNSCPHPTKASAGMLCASWAPAVYQMNGQ